MSNTKIYVLSVVVLTCLLPAASYGQDANPDRVDKEKRPNILLIVTDDMAYTDLGSFGGYDLTTPNLDRLATGGVRLTNFHTAPSCLPTRAMLMSGASNHDAGLGAQRMTDAQRGQPGYEGALQERVVILPELMRDAGYHTYMSGKWHLSNSDENNPATRGFDRSFALCSGSDAHLESNNVSRNYREDGVPLASLPDDFYTAYTYTDKIIEYIDSNRDSGKPFFAWYSPTAPHWPVQAPDEWIDRYRGAYDEGYGVHLEKRVAAAYEAGVLPEGYSSDAYITEKPAWEELDEKRQREHIRTMEVYAAMTEILDLEVGRLVQFLAESGELENTVIIYFNDNGSDGRDMYDVPGYEDMDEIAARFENIGRQGSRWGQGAGWAEAGTAPFRRVKGSMYEGGIRTPAFVYHQSVVNKGGTDNRYVNVMDVMPTILEIAGTSHPGEIYHDHPVIPMRGKSFLDIVQNADAAPVHAPDEAIGFESAGDAALVRGPWKLVLDNFRQGGKWELYNLDEDPGETTDRITEQAELAAEMLSQWQDFAETTGVVVLHDVAQ